MARFTDGHPTTIALTTPAAIKLYETAVTPPSVEGGGANDTTTMLNVAWRTRQPKKLKTLGEMSVTASFEGATYDDVVTAINVNQLITITFPDDSTLAFWGWMDAFEPSEFTEGEQPTADVTFIASNQNATGTETAPIYTAPPP